jgi:hypothetical protein
MAKEADQGKYQQSSFNPIRLCICHGISLLLGTGDIPIANCCGLLRFQ